MTSREVHVAAVARGDGDAKAGAGATVSEEETPAAPQRAARQKYVAAWLMAADGHTYERRAITEWFAHHDTSPNTNLALEHKHLAPALLARQHVQRWMDECRAAGVDPDSLN